MTRPADLAGSWRVASRTTGVAGLVAFVLLFGSQGLIQIGGAEPAFGAPADTIAAFFAARDPGLYSIGSYLGILSLLAFIWFLGGSWAHLREAEGEPAWRSTAGLLSGGIYVATVVLGGWELARFRWSEGVDPQIARLAFDLGNLSFAAGWVALGSFSVASGWIVLESRVAPRWVGWLAIAAGVGLVLARAVWTTPFWFLPYAVFWLWVVVVSIRLLRRAWPWAGSAVDAARAT